MQEHSTIASKPKLVLNRSKLDELRRAHGIQTEAELARRIGVDESTLFRVSRGEVAPSNLFMARVIVAFPQASFASLFNVETAA